MLSPTRDYWEKKEKFCLGFYTVFVKMMKHDILPLINYLCTLKFEML